MTTNPHDDRPEPPSHPALGGLGWLLPLLLAGVLAYLGGQAAGLVAVEMVMVLVLGGSIIGGAVLRITHPEHRSFALGLIAGGCTGLLLLVAGLVLFLYGLAHSNIPF